MVASIDPVPDQLCKVTLKFLQLQFEDHLSWKDVVTAQRSQDSALHDFKIAPWSPFD